MQVQGEMRALTDTVCPRIQFECLPYIEREKGFSRLEDGRLVDICHTVLDGEDAEWDVPINASLQ